VSRPASYTDLIDLAEILDKNWATIAAKVLMNASHKKEILADLRRLNKLRRKVMHPVRSTLPNDAEFEEEFKFVCSFAQKILEPPDERKTK
jgi:hypothetical protein